MLKHFKVFYQEDIMKRLLIHCFLAVALSAPLPVWAADVLKPGDKNWKVAAVQQKLPLLGIKVDREDGLFTKETGRAIESFQKTYKKRYKLKVNGFLDDITYQAVLESAYDKTAPRVAAGDILKTAARYKGVPYRFGGADTKGFDCSGYISYVFYQHKVGLSRTADTQYKEGIFVLKKNLRPGDLVFFTTYEKGPSHVGIYAGDDKFWHASSSRGVMLSGLGEDYWRTRYVGARRILAG